MGQFTCSPGVPLLLALGDESAGSYHLTKQSDGYCGCVVLRVSPAWAGAQPQPLAGICFALCATGDILGCLSLGVVLCVPHLEGPRLASSLAILQAVLQVPALVKDGSRPESWPFSRPALGVQGLQEQVKLTLD